jgi:phage terminase large subunit-like protein
MADWDRCVDRDARPVLSDPGLAVWVGLDGSYQHDSTGIAAVTYDATQQKVGLVAHKIFTPTKDRPVDFAAVEEELLGLRRRFALRSIFFDPYQLVSLSQRMTTLGLPMEPFTQTTSNLEAAATNLAELIRHHNLSVYEDSEIRLALSRTVAVETARGVRISKSKASHRVDVIAALSFACFAAVREGQFKFEYAYEGVSRELSGRALGSADRDSLNARGEDVAELEDMQAAIGRGGRWGGSARRRWDFY